MFLIFRRLKFRPFTYFFTAFFVREYFFIPLIQIALTAKRHGTAKIDQSFRGKTFICDKVIQFAYPQLISEISVKQIGKFRRRAIINFAVAYVYFALLPSALLVFFVCYRLIARIICQVEENFPALNDCKII